MERREEEVIERREEEKNREVEGEVAEREKEVMANEEEEPLQELTCSFVEGNDQGKEGDRSKEEKDKEAMVLEDVGEDLKEDTRKGGQDLE